MRATSGSSKRGGKTIFWKIDYFDKALLMHFPDAADSNVVERRACLTVKWSIFRHAFSILFIFAPPKLGAECVAAFRRLLNRAFFQQSTLDVPDQFISSFVTSESWLLFIARSINPSGPEILGRSEETKFNAIRGISVVTGNIAGEFELLAT
jgi:hypothetical protein